MKRLVLSLLISSISTLPFAAMADHPPKRLLKNLMAFSALGKTGKLAEFDVDAAVGALLCDGRLKSLDDKAGDYSSFLKTTPYRMSRFEIFFK